MNAEIKKLTKEEVVKKFRTTEILEASRKILYSHGVENLTLERVAEEAGISKGTIYLYFKNKNDLIITLIEDMATEGIAAFEQHLSEREMAPIDKIILLVRFFLDRHFSEHEMMRLFTAEMNIYRLDPESDEIKRVLMVREKLYSIIAGLVAEGCRIGVFGDIDAEAYGRLIGHLLEGYAMHILIANDSAAIGRATDEIIDFITRGVRK